MVIIGPNSPDGGRISIAPTNGATYDMRGVTVRAEPIGALIDFSRPQTFCVTGGSAIARYPDGFVVNWPNVKVGDDAGHGPYDEGGFHTSRPQPGTTVFDRVFIEGVEDGLMISRLPKDAGQNGDPPSPEYWELRHSYLRNILDDAIENDGFRSGKIIDVLSEGTHMFYSARNTHDESFHTLLIQDSVIGFACKPDPRTDDYHGEGACPEGSSTNFMLKLLRTSMPEITMSNTVIHHPAVPRSGRSALCMPNEGHYSNVTVVWTGSIPYPCALPPDGGISLTQDITVYERARASWLRRHGCKPDGTDCAFLRR